MAFFGSDTKFLSHSGNYQLRQFDWPLKDAEPKSKILIDKVPEIKDEDFAGIYGYNDTFFHSGFLNENFFVFSADYKGQERIYLFDTNSQELSVLQLKPQPKSQGHYTLMRRHRNMLIVKYMEAN